MKYLTSLGLDTLVSCIMLSIGIGLSTLTLLTFVLVVEPQEIYDGSVLGTKEKTDPRKFLVIGYTPRLGKRVANEYQMDEGRSAWESSPDVKDYHRIPGSCGRSLSSCATKRAEPIIYEFPPFIPRPGRKDTIDAVKNTYSE